MQEIKVFENSEFGKVRVSVVNGDPMFCLSDVCKVLDLHTGMTKQRLDEKGVSSIDTLTKGGVQPLIYINEKNLYRVIMRSDKPQAEPFQDWVCGDVLPSIRKNGAYMTPETIEKTLTSPDFIIKLATQLKSILVRELAKLITQNGYQIGEKQLYERLRKAGYLCSVGESRNQPTQTYMNIGLFEIKKRVIMDGDEAKVYNTTVVTPKGVHYFINKFLGKGMK